MVVGTIIVIIIINLVKKFWPKPKEEVTVYKECTEEDGEECVPLDSTNACDLSREGIEYVSPLTGIAHDLDVATTVVCTPGYVLTGLPDDTICSADNNNFSDVACTPIEDYCKFDVSIDNFTPPLGLRITETIEGGCADTFTLNDTYTCNDDGTITGTTENAFGNDSCILQVDEDTTTEYDCNLPQMDNYISPLTGLNFDETLQNDVCKTDYQLAGMDSYTCSEENKDFSGATCELIQTTEDTTPQTTTPQTLLSPPQTTTTEDTTPQTTTPQTLLSPPQTTTPQTTPPQDTTPQTTTTSRLHHLKIQRPQDYNTSNYNDLKIQHLKLQRPQDYNTSNYSNSRGRCLLY